MSDVGYMLGAQHHVDSLTGTTFDLVEPLMVFTTSELSMICSTERNYPSWCLHLVVLNNRFAGLYRDG